MGEKGGGRKIKEKKKEFEREERGRKRKEREERTKGKEKEKKPNIEKGRQKDEGVGGKGEKSKTWKEKKIIIAWMEGDTMRITDDRIIKKVSSNMMILLCLKEICIWMLVIYYT